MLREDAELPNVEFHNCDISLYLFQDRLSPFWMVISGYQSLNLFAYEYLVSSDKNEPGQVL